MKKFLLLSFVLGCAEPLPIIVYDEREAHHDPESELPDEVLGACDIWEVACEAEDDDDGSYGRLIVEIFEGGASVNQSGRNFIKGICRKAFWSKEEERIQDDHLFGASLEQVIAHEMGHAFGFRNHSSDEENIMFPIPGDKVSEEQIDTVQRKMDLFVQCIP